MRIEIRELPPYRFNNVVFLRESARLDDKKNVKADMYKKIVAFHPVKQLGDHSYITEALVGGGGQKMVIVTGLMYFNKISIVFSEDHFYELQQSWEFLTLCKFTSVDVIFHEVTLQLGQILQSSLQHMVPTLHTLRPILLLARKPATTTHNSSDTNPRSPQQHCVAAARHRRPTTIKRRGAEPCVASFLKSNHACSSDLAIWHWREIP